MSWYETLAAGAGAALLGLVFKKVREEQAETRRRLESPLCFDDGITQEEFSRIVHKAVQRAPRIIKVSIEGMVVTFTVESNTGLSVWNTTIDFNDYGHLTGKYWLNTDNQQSVIPQSIARWIQEGIHEGLQPSVNADQRA